MIESEKISAEDQREYQWVVGMLFYLVKHLQQDITHATRELSKCEPCSLQGKLTCDQACFGCKKSWFEDRTNRKCQQILGDSLFYQ